MFFPVSVSFFISSKWYSKSLFFEDKYRDCSSSVKALSTHSSGVWIVPTKPSVCWALLPYINGFVDMFVINLGILEETNSFTDVVIVLPRLFTTKKISFLTFSVKPG